VVRLLRLGIAADRGWKMVLSLFAVVVAGVVTVELQPLELELERPLFDRYQYCSKYSKYSTQRSRLVLE